MKEWLKTNWKLSSAIGAVLIIGALIARGRVSKIEVFGTTIEIPDRTSDRRIDAQKAKDALEQNEKQQTETLKTTITKHQIDLYSDAIRAASVLASYSSGPERDAQEKRFYELTYGGLMPQEDHRVDDAMLAFRGCWMSNDPCKRTEKDLDPNIQLPQADKVQLSKEIGACVQKVYEEQHLIDTISANAVNTLCPYR